MRDQGAAIPAYDHRTGRAPTLVFLHYWGGSARTWQPVLDRLPGRATLTIEARGWGRSRRLPGPYTLRQLAQDTHDIVADAGLGDYVLVGHSMGGKVAQLVAATRPAGLTGLVLVAPGPARPAAFVTPEYRQTLAQAYETDETAAAARDTVLTATPLDEDLKNQVVADSRASAPEARLEWPLRGIAEDITREARGIEVAALVLAGGLDRVEPPEVLRDNLVPYLGNAEFRVIPGSGHLVPLEAPAELAGILREFGGLSRYL
ncbi:alpha/beta fold hydrolase [Amycolatopsis saalfeldensis]|uniref:Pimeloyl-ACP methyl ester carboxylesterase n=1 Tax=Amycolatopsis saalfeldensis TaxID=394193 RepID=A0A1H8YKZ2_9PSEU|nr:alpha/beta hydrolase [Amycolatopsis saalfeldensis]SEP52845.1 Pimeloyl-ACP methyl ester carboxylesterase [Amycolatopsis saalfeldensis]